MDLAELRVTYVARRAWPSRGGISSYVRLVSDALPPLGRVQVVTPRTDQVWPAETDVLVRAAFAPFERGQVTTEPLRVRGAVERVSLVPTIAAPHVRWLPRGPGWLSRRGFAGFAVGVGRAIARLADRPRLLHVVGGGSLAAAGVVAAERLSVPLVVTPSTHPGGLGDDPQSAAAYRAAALVLAYNEVDAATYRRLGVDDRRLAIAAPCTAVMPARSGGTELRRRHGIEEPLVLFIGARQPYKGLDLLLQAIGELSARGRPATLAALGNGPPPDTRRAAGARVIDAGSVDDREKAAWLDAADVLVLPSSNESYGLVLAEAWSMGTPVITSDIPVLAALVAESGGGIATRREPAALADALEELLADPARARALGAGGRRYWAGHLTPQAAADRLLRLYAALLDKS